jgi:hypothetical protein
MTMAIQPQTMLSTVLKNSFFNYVQVAGAARAYRTREQIWNGANVTMKVQGDMPDANAQTGYAYNAFAKKHLLSALRTNDTPIAKATRIVSRRENRAPVHTARTVALSKMGANAVLSLQNAPTGTALNQAIKDMKSHLETQIEAKVFGQTQTNVSTFVLLDLLGGNQAKTDFDAAIGALAGNWADGVIKEVDVLFAVQDSVVEVKLNGLPVYGNGMRVKVLKEQAANVSIYHIFHCDGLV